ncbi:MAG: divergent polysaccharide deacetylase family protein [Candidatus Omnitrophica bacterium]|nr:divergent polysaccharide deacetylase family protein [Candidatus Omnitrophota bacterium]
MKKKLTHGKRNHSQRNLIAVVCALILISFLCGIFISKLYQPKPPKIPKVSIKKPTLGVIALIIDDWGSSKNVSTFITTTDVPVAISVLPKLPYSKTIAECAYANGKEIMLHLPMEPYHTTDHYPKDYIITASMKPEKIKSLIDEFLLTVPGAQGFNNHMGSKATEDKKLMKIVYSYFKEKNFFIVDSFVSDKSVCEVVAKDLGVPFIKRDVFLDNKADRIYIENRIAELTNLAQQQGHAVGIGHARPLTLQVLEEQIPILKEKGFKFVTVREMIKNTKAAKGKQ